MLQPIRRFPLIAVLVLGTALTACGGDDPSDPDDDDDPSTVTFTFDPPAGAPEVTSVTVPGVFNEWNPAAAGYAMTEQANGTWQLEVELEPGTYEYKYFVNGAWVENMCDDATWGDPVSPQNEGCVGATNNATVTVE